jgi:hypothetical protein
MSAPVVAGRRITHLFTAARGVSSAKVGNAVAGAENSTHTTKAPYDVAALIPPVRWLLPGASFIVLQSDSNGK